MSEARWEHIESEHKEFLEKQLKSSSLLRKLEASLKPTADSNPDWMGISLRRVDKLLKEHWSEITCGEIAAIYWKFWLELKKLKGNSQQFTGLAEFLIIRTLLHQLAAFEESTPRQYSKDGSRCYEGYFFSEGHQVYVAPEYFPKKLRSTDKGYPRPDIVLCRNNPNEEKSFKPVGIVSVKIYFTQGGGGVKDETETLRKLQRKFKQHPPKILLLIFGRMKPKNENRKRKGKSVLEKLKDTKVPFCVLWDKPEMLMKDVFEKHLALNELSRTKFG